MYDSKNEAVEFVADTREEAVTKACRFFVADEPDLTIVEPEPGEIFGLGARPPSTFPTRGGTSTEFRS